MGRGPLNFGNHCFIRLNRTRFCPLLMFIIKQIVDIFFYGRGKRTSTCAVVGSDKRPTFIRYSYRILTSSDTTVEKWSSSDPISIFSRFLLQYNNCNQMIFCELKSIFSKHSKLLLSEYVHSHFNNFQLGCVLNTF